MKKFSFRLQTVLDHAQREEDRLKQELSRLQMRLQEAMEKLSQLRQRRLETRADYLKKTKGPVNIDEIKTLKGNLEMLDKVIQQQLKEVADIEDAIAKKIPEVVKGMQKRQILDQLKERKQLEHKKESERLEINLIDDTTTPRHARQATL